MVTAGYNIETGQYAAGANHRGSCAEACVVDQLGGDPSKIRFVNAVHPRNKPASEPLKRVPICMICEATYGQGAFKERGTTYCSLDNFDRSLFPSAPAVAACLVRGLDEAADFVEKRALEILVEMSGSIPEGPDDRPGDHALYRECMAEVVRGFPAYTRTLRSGTSLSARLVCVDLILMCGLHDEGLRADAIRSLEEVSRFPEFAAHSRLLTNSLEELGEQQ